MSEGCLPILLGFQIRFRIGVTGNRVNMLFKATDPFIAGVRVDMALLNIVANIFLLGSNDLKTFIPVDMRNGNGLCADQNSFGSLSGFGLALFLTTDDHIVPGIAFIAMTVARIFRKRTDQVLLIAGCFVNMIFLLDTANENRCRIVADVIMDMGFVNFRADKRECVAAISMNMPFRNRTGQLVGHNIARFVVAVAAALNFLANQLSPLKTIASLGMDMQYNLLSFTGSVTVISMLMGTSLVERTYQFTVRIEALLIMGMGQIVCLTTDQCASLCVTSIRMRMNRQLISSTNQISVRSLFVTRICVCMFFKATKCFLLHGNGRQNQNIGSAKNDQTCKCSYNFP